MKTKLQTERIAGKAGNLRLPHRLLSFALALIMMMSAVITVLPEMEVGAATAASISSLKLTSTTAYEGDSIGVRGTVNSGSYYLRAIQVNVRRNDNDGHGFKVQKVTFGYSEKKTSYSLSNIDEFIVGAFTCTGDERTEYLDEGRHRVDIHVGLYDKDGSEATGFTKSLYFTVESEPEVEQLSRPSISSPDEDDTFYGGKDITFKWGKVSNADGYEYELYDTSVYPEKLIDSGEKDGNTTSSRKVTIDGSYFKGGRSYKFRVKALGSGSYSDSEWDAIYIYVDNLDLSTDPEDELSFSYDKSSQTLKIVSSCDWTVSTTANWITLSDASGSGTDTITVTVSANAGRVHRTGVIVIKEDGGAVLNITVLQEKGLVDELEIDKNTVAADAGDNDYRIYVQSNIIDWEVTTDADWLTISPKSGDEDGDFLIKVDPNPDFSTRTATVTVTGHDITRTITVTQAARVLDPDQLILGDVNGDGEVTNLDRFILNRYLAKLPGYDDSKINKETADINGDRKVAAEDAKLLANHLAGMKGYENLYEHRISGELRPTVTGVQTTYYVKKGETLTVPFTIKALNSGKVERMTLQHNVRGSSFAPISYDCNTESYSGSFTISGHPLNTVGTHEFIIYCRASNYKVTDNTVAVFYVVVTEDVCYHPTYTDTYVSTGYSCHIKTLNTHDYYHNYKRVCSTCGFSLGIVKGLYEEGEHKIGSKGYCPCGYIDTSNYDMKDGKASTSGAIVYSTPESTGEYGSLNPSEQVIILGECCGRYLVQYYIDGTNQIKQGFVKKGDISKIDNRYTIRVYDNNANMNEEKYYMEYVNRVGTLFAEQKHYYAIKVYDNTDKKFASVGASLKLVLELDNPSAKGIRIDEFGTLNTTSGTGRLKLYNNGVLMDEIFIYVATYNNSTTPKEASRWQTYDSAEKSAWSYKDPNSKKVSCINVCKAISIYEYDAEYDSKTDSYDVTMTVYNKSALVYGVDVYNEDGILIDTNFIGSHWFEVEIIKGAVDFVTSIGDASQGKPVANIAEKTDIKVNVPSGGYIMVSTMYDNEMIFSANLITFFTIFYSVMSDVYDTLKPGVSLSMEDLTNFKKIINNKGVMKGMIDILSSNDKSSRVLKEVIMKELADVAEDTSDELKVKACEKVFDTLLSGGLFNKLLDFLLDSAKEYAEGFFWGFVSIGEDIALTALGVSAVKDAASFIADIVQVIKYVVSINTMSRLQPTWQDTGALIVYPRTTLYWQ